MAIDCSFRKLNWRSIENCIKKSNNNREWNSKIAWRTDWLWMMNNVVANSFKFELSIWIIGWTNTRYRNSISTVNKLRDNLCGLNIIIHTRWSVGVCVLWFIAPAIYFRPFIHHFNSTAKCDDLFAINHITYQFCDRFCFDRKLYHLLWRSMSNCVDVNASASEFGVMVCIEVDGMHRNYLCKKIFFSMLSECWMRKCIIKCYKIR